jgi:transcriptional regulator with XRE-family HTH domain
MEELGTRLQRFRLTNGWSKRVVAKKLGVSIPSIIRWEEGAVEPNDYNRYKIERLLSHARPIAHSGSFTHQIHQLHLFGKQVENVGETPWPLRSLKSS